ncbi:MAG: cardiolipin synthase [Muribaculaceae bacterium]|nr:cardiolipin synthase [Muribaculaceae bacterium]
MAEITGFTWLYWALMTAYGITVLSVIVVILSENRAPVKSLAWVTVLLLLPAVGLLLYFFFGRNISTKRVISRRNLRRLKRRESLRRPDFNHLHLSPESIQQVRLTHALTGARFYHGNRALTYAEGADKFNALLADIASARHYIHMQYYIIADDVIGRRVQQALIARAREGVKVRIIFDHVGSYGTSSRFFREMREAGIEVAPFFKVVFPLFATRLNWRNHRKIVIIDGTVGYIGGMNIADRYVTGGKAGHWRDLHLRVTGPAVASLQFAFAVDWNFMGNDLLDETVAPGKPTTAHGDRGGEKTGEDPVLGMQLITSGPTSHWSNVGMVFMKAIANAKRRVFIMTPYFIPDESLLRALQAASLAKVDVRIMMPRRPDSRMLRYASSSYVAECLRAGIKVYLYEKGMFHSKALIIDDELSTVGSTNFDFRSFDHNFEANMFIYSREYNAWLTEQFKADMADSTRVNPEQWRARPRPQKILESLTRLLAPIL